METQRGRTVPVVKDFNIEGSWAPATPTKPNNPRLGPIYDDGQGGLLTQAWGYPPQNDPQILLSSYSISSRSNNVWVNTHETPYLLGGIQLQAENVEVHRRGLEENLPHWSSQGRRSLMSNGGNIGPSSYPRFSSWDLPLPWNNNGAREIVATLDSNFVDSMEDFNTMSFGDLLGINNGAGASNGLFHPGWVSQPESSRLNDIGLLNDRDVLSGINQRPNGLYDRGMQNEALPQPFWSMANANLPQRNGSTAFAPETPDLRHRLRSGASENAYLCTNQGLNNQNVLQEHEIAAVIADLQDDQYNNISEVVADSTPAKVSKARDEDYSPDKEVIQDIDLNKTPQKKPRKRRYQPKVIRENKPKHTQKPRTSMPNDSKGTELKRKSARKNKASTPSTIPFEEAAEPKSTKPTVKSCKRSLHFDMNLESNGCLDGEAQVRECQEIDNSSHPLHKIGEEKLMVKTSMTAHDLNHTMNQERSEYILLPVNNNRDSAQTDMGIASHLAQCLNASTCASSSEGKQTGGSKRSLSYRTDPTYIDIGIGAITQSMPWQPDHISSKIPHTEILPQSFIPETCKKKRTEMQRLHMQSTSFVALSEEISRFGKAHGQLQVELPTSKYYYCNSAANGINRMTNNQTAFVRRSENSELSKTWADLSRLKKKRTKWATRVRDLTPFTGIASAAMAASMKNGGTANGHYSCNATLNGVLSCMEALAADTIATPKSKRKPRKQDSENNNWNIVLYDHNHSTREATDSISALSWRKRSSSIANLTNLFQQLDINKEHKISIKEKAVVPYKKQNQNALVLYEKFGSIVPFEGPFNPIRKRRPRAKVDLDDETTRVWRLLLENIDNEGIDGTDEDKEKWWDHERCVFRGRVDSFIARMRLVQGDRRFTPWKGSVLDSVIGVFLTQNVSDHLSSSAFMTMAARFPLKPESTGSTLSEATSALFEEPEICIIEPEESNFWSKKAVDQPTLGGKYRVIYDFENTEEKEVINGNGLIGKACQVSPAEGSSESCQKLPNDSTVITPNSQTTETEAPYIVEDDKAKDCGTSSQQSVISSQNSVSSSSLKPVEIMDLFSESNSRTQAVTANNTSSYLESRASFLGLLKMADYSSQTHIQDQLKSVKHVAEYHQETPGASSSNYQLILEGGSYLQDAKGIEMFEEESRFSGISRKEENSPTTEQSSLTSELTDQEKSQDTFPRVAQTTSSCYVLEGETMVMQSQMQKVKGTLDPIASSALAETSKCCKGINVEHSFRIMADVTECTRGLEGAEKHKKDTYQNPRENTCASGVLPDMANANPSKTEKGKAGKEKKNEFDWDSLRKDAEVNGKKPERPANNRDSVDWEAVRHADVNDIAETIKERGMNNMLAERIKGLLDRLVKDHGSTDMEWLRDIPPDKAKEYLLSFRGLGLKSVECVRLLTLHHLAFPVDTNVGRIAVRLGWVPLQPLPESLQLHLLEMYPILESIQKYLWPRLCKLDQKTLYELHYHMITFGKVFCTKRQPNCNACPLRGECRHFASAFASARFSLPGPEERSIMPSGATTTSNVNVKASTNLLPSTASWGSHTHSYYDSGDASTNQVPSFPLSLPFPQNVHLERKSINSKCEPIVEVPASPEQEPQNEHALFDIEDTFYEDPNEIPTINLNMEEFSQTLQNFMHANRELQEAEMSNALVALTPDAASIPTPKLKNINRLRTEHYVYELPDTHPLLHGMEKREPDDPCSYLLAIWTPGETANSIDPPARRCSFENTRMLCNEDTCSYCSSQRESDSQVVRGTLLIPTRTAMRGSFPLNGTYFQVNEVFADHDSSLSPIAVPRSWLWNLPRRTVYFGTSIPTIFKGMTTEDIQHCFWRGYVCVRGFDKKTRAPRPLMARLHFPASRITRGVKGKVYDE
ncbi:hypothetical protein vseg_003482 [Gypsophila vaccaria]